MKNLKEEFCECINHYKNYCQIYNDENPKTGDTSKEVKEILTDMNSIIKNRKDIIENILLNHPNLIDEYSYELTIHNPICIDKINKNLQAIKEQQKIIFEIN